MDIKAARLSSRHPLLGTYLAGASPRVVAAAQFAAKAHAGQTRKTSATPYITHPLRVSRLLREYGCSDDVAVAAALHDVLEDTETKPEAIAAAFGPKVLKLVKGVSEDKSLPWEERKQRTIDSIRTASPDLLLLICGDKLDNVQDLRHEHKMLGERVWTYFTRPREEQCWYYRSLAKALQARADVHLAAPLIRAFVAEVEACFPSRLPVVKVDEPLIGRLRELWTSYSVRAAMLPNVSARQPIRSKLSDNEARLKPLAGRVATGTDPEIASTMFRNVVRGLMEVSRMFAAQAAVRSQPCSLKLVLPKLSGIATPSRQEKFGSIVAKINVRLADIQLWADGNGGDISAMQVTAGRHSQDGSPKPYRQIGELEKTVKKVNCQLANPLAYRNAANFLSSLATFHLKLYPVPKGFAE
jgi:guanosine-3',5'-bis(diphosphate) 3'-pyrophosphohydrolase